jgi:RimJ/RimL family protein N-acetyltransferase
MRHVQFLLRTERLMLRPFAFADLNAMHGVFSDPEVMRYVPGGPRDRKGSLARLRSLIDHQEKHGFSKWAVVTRTSRQVIGDCGLQYLADGSDIELGFHLSRAHWSHGYATEAGRACLAWALAERPERVVAIVDPANMQSIRVLRKIGMQSAGMMSYLDREWALYVACHQGSGTS